MGAGRANLNLLVAGGRRFLLVETPLAGAAVHLAEAASGTTARGAVPDSWVRDGDIWIGEEDEQRAVADIATRYDLAALMKRQWSSRTLCGREWLDMAGGDGGPLSKDGLDAVAPSCRRCLASMDSLFPAVEPDDRIELLSRFVTEAVSRTGGAAVHHVPGDQIEPLRRAIRKAIRARLGFKSRTFVIDSSIHVTSAEAFELVREEQMKKAAAVLSRLFSGEEDSEPAMLDHVFSWLAWG